MSFFGLWFLYVKLPFVVRLKFLLFSFRLVYFVPNATIFSSNSRLYGLVMGLISSGKLMPGPENT